MTLPNGKLGLWLKGGAIILSLSGAAVGYGEFRGSHNALQEKVNVHIQRGETKIAEFDNSLITLGRMDERLKAIEQSQARIEAKLDRMLGVRVQNDTHDGMVRKNP